MLQLAGARIVKVEDVRRPDGARHISAFFDLMHGGQQSVALDFGTASGRSALRELIRQANVLIEASRPRALRQLGADADSFDLDGRPQVWISITGYGRQEPAASRVAFGDDAAVAGSLVAWDQEQPMFCADAVADPISGLEAAAHSLEMLVHGHAGLLE